MSLSKIIMGITAIVISIFMLFYIFDNISKLADNCKTEASPSEICKHLSSFTMSMLILLLIIGGFFLTITTTVYILLSS